MRADIEQLLADFHEDIVARDDRAAWQLLTARKRASFRRRSGYAKWRAAQDSLRPFLDPTGIHVRIRDLDATTGVATVSVTGMRWSRPGARCATWSGITWVKYEDGTWRYDPGYSTTPQRAREWRHHVAQLLGGSC